MNEHSFRHGASKLFIVSGLAEAAAAAAYDATIDGGSPPPPLGYFEATGCATTSTSRSASDVATITTTCLSGSALPREVKAAGQYLGKRDEGTETTVREVGRGGGGT